MLCRSRRRERSRALYTMRALRAVKRSLGSRDTPRHPHKHCGRRRLDRRTPHYDDMRPIELVFAALWMPSEPAKPIGDEAASAWP
ncbi:hypothetical protein T484DRAFT_1934877 [Baffinella frigidus]|nr:hypothetical protein T484DRAFT_1934877 [Cryptophyta sp. CCMP2293]